jgi:hypothetical protein
LVAARLGILASAKVPDVITEASRLATVGMVPSANLARVTDLSAMFPVLTASAAILGLVTEPSAKF